jgi:hypothetical protein
LDANLILFYQFATLYYLLLIKYSNNSYFYLKIINMPETTKKIIIEYGLVTGITILSFHLMLFFLDAHVEDNMITFLTQFAILFIGLTLGNIAFKKANSSEITGAEVRKIGTGISLITAIILVLYMFILANILDPDYWYKYTEFQYNYYSDMFPESFANISLSEYIEQTEPRNSTFGYPSEIIITILLGFIYSVILGFIIRTKKIFN